MMHPPATNRPLVIDAAEFVCMYAESWYAQGKNAGHAEQFAKDQEEDTALVSPDSKPPQTPSNPLKTDYDTKTSTAIYGTAEAQSEEA